MSPTPTLSPSARTLAATVPPLPRRRQYRERDFGIGYGRSSGYGDSRRYASDWGALRFRCR